MPARGEEYGAVPHRQPLAPAHSLAPPDLPVEAAGLDPLVTLGAPLPKVLVGQEGRHAHCLLAVLIVVILILLFKGKDIGQTFQSPHSKLSAFFWFKGYYCKVSSLCKMSLVLQGDSKA